MNQIRTLAFVGAVGGAGTTRSAVECATALARGGDDVAVLDAAFATQGLSELVAGRLDPDLTDLCLDPDRPLSDGLVDFDVPTEGRVAVAPARAPFERVARAKSADAAQVLERRIHEAATAFDYVVVDTPPIAANQAVAAVHAVDRVVLVAPNTDHGADALNRQRDVLRDVDAPDQTPLTLTVGDDPDADVSIPNDTAPLAAAPACLGTDPFAAAVVDATETLVDTDLDVEFEDSSVVGRVRSGVDRVRGGD